MKKILGLGILLLLPNALATSIHGGTPEAQAVVQQFLVSTNTTQYVYRIDLLAYQHQRWQAYAWYRAQRIVLYADAWRNGVNYRVLAHELGHLIAEERGLNRYNYAHNERMADMITEELLA